MATREEKKEAIRQQIVRAAEIYSRELAGKTFLYVYGQEYFEVSFMTDRFLHLTGVQSKLSAKDFYKKARSKKLDAIVHFDIGIDRIGNLVYSFNKIGSNTNWGWSEDPGPPTRRGDPAPLFFWAEVWNEIQPSRRELY
ncbi:MAG: hypothetical protein IJ865_00930 [Clostridia bacterium]|nr:hypothetical protein [Clostridia bacterium]